ncbi:MAG: hypothetical protein O4859_16680 [Trichodesmium sp. St18_bin1]|nr:hypothetical protein [Trichodesmium sp. St18_bin1]
MWFINLKSAVKARGKTLDFNYFQLWSDRLQLTTKLEKAFNETNLKRNSKLS